MTTILKASINLAAGALLVFCQSTYAQALPAAAPLVTAATAATAATATAAGAPSKRMISKGEYVAIAADCAACHTTKGGAAFAGGYSIKSPMGIIWATNITPSKQFGIGNYTLEQFARAVREGVTPDGHRLYPAMPYTAYALMTDEDTAALYQYLMKEVKPVEVASKTTDLPFPFNVRASMIGWNALYANNKPFVADTSKSVEYNRGRYLVDGLAHCTACHTPRTFLMGEDLGRPLGGGSLGSWYAPNISADKANGIGGWSDVELYTYLKTGHATGKGQAAGPMAEAVENSLQHLNDTDLRAIVTYLKQTPAVAGNEAQPRYAVGQPSMDELAMRGNAVKNVDAGWKVYTGTCAACHGAQGEGAQGYPSLFHNTTTGAGRSDNLVATILYGVQRTVAGKEVAMPAFGPSAAYTERLSDQQVADVANYVLKNFGQARPDVTPQSVALMRAGGATPTLVLLTRYGIPAAIVLAVALALLLVRRSRKGKPS
jgi:mono/diheme cytochrome c family protein